MAADDFDEFATDSGLKDDFDAVVVGALFSPGEYGTTLTLNLRADDGDEVDAMYRCGPDWATFDGGQTIEHPSKKLKLNARSQLAVLTRHAMTAGAEDVIKKRSAANGKIGPRGAVIWPGLKFHWTVVETAFDIPNQKNDDGSPVKGTSVKQYPATFLGEVEVSEGETSTGSSTPGEIPEAALKVMTELAQKHEFKEWVDMCLQQEECRDNVVVMKLSDESFYNSLRG